MTEHSPTCRQEARVRDSLVGVFIHTPTVFSTTCWSSIVLTDNLENVEATYLLCFLIVCV